MFFATDALVLIGGGAKATEAAAAYAGLYIKAASLMVFFFAIGTIFQLVSASFGYQTERMISSLLNVVVNIVVSIIAILNMPEGYQIIGLGIGSAIGAFAQMLVAYLFMRRRKTGVKFGFYPINKSNLMDALDCMRRGLPSSMDNLFDSVCTSVVNNIILSIFTGGTGVLALVAIVKTMFTFVKTAGRGSLYVSEPLFGIFHGARDNGGIRSTFKAATKTGVLYAALFAAVIIVFQQPILKYFGAADNVEVRIGLILIAISGIVFIFQFMFNSAYEATDHLVFSIVVASVSDSFLYPVLVFILGKVWGIYGIWIAMGYSFVLFFAIYYVIFMLKNKKVRVSLDNLLLLKNNENRDTAIDISIPVAAEQISFVSERLQHFFLEHNTSPRIAYASALCMEEIAADYIAFRRENGTVDKEAFMDIKAFRDPEQIKIILRNYDDPYDPLVIKREEEQDHLSKIGIVMTQKIASDILYSYAYHLNIVSITINIENGAGR